MLHLFCKLLIIDYRQRKEKRISAPIVSIVGKSDSGKTTLMEKVIRELVNRGYIVGTIKHDVHQFDIDHQGKDSWRHKNAGARTTVVSSPAKVAVIKDVDRELALDELAADYLADVDIILTEGYKREDKPKLEVLASGDTELMSPLNEILLVVSDTPADFGRRAVSRDDIAAAVDVLEARFLKSRTSASDVQLIVDGSPIMLNDMMKTMVGNTIVGLVSALKGVDNPERIIIGVKSRQI